jgi:photosystem II stability/assembly factor-like uncharacterized protein
MNYLKILLLAVWSVSSVLQAQNIPQWEMRTSPAKASFRAISALSAETCWVSGSGGTVLRTTDGGETWQQFKIAGTDSLDFRDIQAFSKDRAVLMGAGPGNLSKIYATEDGGKTWQIKYQNELPEGFFNGFSFWNEQKGLLAGDPIEGKLFILKTEDGGNSWHRISVENIPTMQKEEYGFSASGTHICTKAGNKAWIVTGGAVARVFYSNDGGETWQVSTTPMLHGESSEGIFSVDFRDSKHGLAVGGDYTEKNTDKPTLIISKNGGKTWKEGKNIDLGFRSAVAFSIDKTVICVGQSAESISYDNGKTWQTISQTGFHTLSLSQDKKWAWAAGGKGKIARLKIF